MGRRRSSCCASGDGLVVDLAAELDGEAAIVDVLGRALRAGRRLPLLDAFSTIVTPEALDRLKGLASPPPAPARPTPIIPVGGAVHAIAAYVRGTTGPATAAAIYIARGALKDFFARHQCLVDFAGEPETKEEEDDDEQQPKRGARKAV